MENEEQGSKCGGFLSSALKALICANERPREVAQTLAELLHSAEVELHVSEVWNDAGEKEEEYCVNIAFVTRRDAEQCYDSLDELVELLTMKR